MAPRSGGAAEAIEPRIFEVRGERVILDFDLARIYGVVTGQLNRAVLRNHERFPADFSFVLTREEFDGLMCQIGISSSRGGRRKPVRAFTEHGAMMAASVLSSGRAVKMSVYVVRAFVHMRRELGVRSELERRLLHVEKVLLEHDSALRDIYRQIRPLLLPPPDPPRRRLGFRPPGENG